LVVCELPQQILDGGFLVMLFQKFLQVLEGVGEQGVSHEAHRAGGAFDIEKHVADGGVVDDHQPSPPFWVLGD
jgi:hypothetical protein